MTKIDKQLKEYLEDYIQNESTEKLFAKDPNSFNTRQRVKDPRGKASLVEPQALAELNLITQKKNTLESLTRAMTPDAYKSLRESYPLSDSGSGEFYVSLIRYGMLPEPVKGDKKQKEELGALTGLVAGHYAIVDSLENKDVNKAVDIVLRMAGLDPLEAERSYQYMKFGDQSTAGYMAAQFADIAKRAAIEKLTPEYRAMLDKEAEKDGKSRARAAAELYKTYDSNKDFHGKKPSEVKKTKKK